MNQIKVACLLYCTTHAAQANGLVFFVQLIFLQTYLENHDDDNALSAYEWIE